MLDEMAFRRVLGAGLLGLGLAATSLAAVGTGGCGGSSVESVSDGGSGGGGTRSSGAHCTTVGSYAGPEYVDWNVSPDMSCEGMETFCYESEPPLNTCQDGGVPEPGQPPLDAPAPPKVGCPNVRVLCSTEIGCCESVYTLIAGPKVTFDAPGTLPCCYLAQPGLHSR
jgi:hypothetical protein